MNVRCSTTLKGEMLTDTKAELQWDSIDWKTVYRRVNRLQTRITKAVKQKKWHLVKRLQYLLTHSWYAKMLAVRRVSQNKGRRTAGVDGEKWLTPEAKMNAVLRLSDKRYRAKPLRRVYIEKFGKKEKRPLSIPTMYDRVMQALYSLALSPVAETEGDLRSFGFRVYRSTQDACGQAFFGLSRKGSARWILEGDIKGCFDNINHNWLLRNTKMNKSVLKQFLKAGFVYNQELFPTERGTPQGGVISPILANITLDGIEAMIDEKYHLKQNTKKVNFVRYADDFIVTADSEETAKEVAGMIRRFLKERGLELSKEKTTITHIDKGFDFLGWNFRKYKGKLLIKPSKKSIDKVTSTISDIIKGGKAWTQKDLIDALNPIITGWSNYHQSVVSKEIFCKMDMKVWNMLWRWAKRRHAQDKKSKKWIRNKYWHKEGTRNWVFSSEGKNLKRFSDTKIVRHMSLKLKMNPYLDREYFEIRRDRRSRKTRVKGEAIGL